MDFVRGLFRLIHVIAVSLWLGSLVFIIVVMRAPVQELGRHTALDPMLVRFRRRYKSLLIATVAALAVSGIMTLVVRTGPAGAGYVLLVIAKVLVSAGVIAMFWYVAFVREEPRRRLAPQPSPGLDESPDDVDAPAERTEQEQHDVDFFFRPKRQHALVQWWLVAATVAVIVLGMIAARQGARAADKPKAQSTTEAPAETPNE